MKPACVLPTIAALFLLGWAVPLPPAAADEALTPAQTEAVQKLIGAYLKEHPEAIVDALQEMDARKQAEEAQAQKVALQQRKDELTKDADAPVGGNPAAETAVVEFFDYRCPYCKAVAKDFLETLKQDGNARIVFKEFPILGKESHFAAQAALAANKQGKYLDFHLALMEFKGTLDEAAVLQIARDTGLDVEKLKADMKDPAIEATIQKNYALAEALRINGTPAFIIGDELVPGAMTMDQLKEYLAAARRG